MTEHQKSDKGTYCRFAGQSLKSVGPLNALASYMAHLEGARLPQVFRF